MVANEPNAGGASVVSEALSMEYLAQRLSATNVITEMAIDYWSFNWKRVDYICDIVGRRVGVSVTRAMGFPTADIFQQADARRLLVKKLHGLIVARWGVCERQRYETSVLHCWCQDGRIADLMVDAYRALGPGELEGIEDVVVLLSVAEGVPAIFTDDQHVLVSA